MNFVEKFSILKKSITENRKLYLVLRMAAALLIILIIGYGIWHALLPEPKKIHVSLQAPGLTPLEKNAVPDPLYITFSGSAARLEDIQKTVSKGIETAPVIAGQWEWISDDQLEFTPQNDWPAETEISVRMEQELFPPHVLLDKYKISFQTKPFKLSIISNTFYIDPVKEDLKQVAATVTFSHPVNPESFEKKVLLRPYKLSKDIVSFEDRKYDVTITYDDYYGKAFILSEGLPMPEDDVSMALTIEEGVECSTKGVESEKDVSSRVTIPGITNYIRINSVSQTIVRNNDYQLEQVLIINTKGRARARELANNMEVWVLPNDKPETPGTRAIENYSWTNPAMVGPEALKLSSRISLTPLESEHEYEDVNSFKIKVDPLKYLYIKIKKGAPFYGKYNLSKNYESTLRVKDFPKQLEIMHEGILLSSSGQKKVSLVAQGIEDVQFRIGRVQPDQLNHLVTQTNGDITNLRFQNYRFSEENLVENYYETESLKKKKPGESNYFSFDFSRYLKPEAGGRLKHGIFFFEVKEWDPARRRTRSYGDERLIMISDLGVLVKDGADDAHDIFVQSISSGLPISGAKVQVLGKNGIPILSAYTDLQGHISMPSLKSFENEKTATVYVISKDDDLSFMPVQAPGRWLNYSRFDVGGVHGSSDPQSINAYLFSDRGIYRPGDEFNIGIIVKSGNWSGSLIGTPLEAVVLDPRGLEIYRKKFKLNAEGFEELQYLTESSSLTGTYQINLYTIRKEKRYRNIGSETIKIEEFLPDRLSITSIFPGVGNRAWVPPKDLKGLVTLRNLFGSPARGNRIAANISLSPGRMWFQQYRDYSFTDPFTSEKSFTETLTEQTTDDDGKAWFDFNLERFDASTYTLKFSADGFEKEGGRNVSTESRILVSPLAYLIGTKPNGDLSYIYKDAQRSLNVIAVSPDLKKTAVGNVQFELTRIQHVSVLTKMENGTYAYKSVPKKIFVSNSKKNIPASGMIFNLFTGEPGDYELVIKNSDDIQFSTISYSVVGMGNITRSLDKTAELEIKLNKEDYEQGEEIELYVKAPYKGAGLITIEKDKIYSYQWFKSQSNSFIKTITLPTELEGNGYVNVSFVRAADSKEIYMSPLSYGIAPFLVSKKNRMNKISIDIPSQSRSGETFPIKYKTAKPGKIVVFAVDEGILQVAGYKTPDPLAYFFKKRALEVKTSQLLDLILPEISLFQLRSEMGGGAGFEEITKNLNPFKRKRDKPVAYWSGLLDCGPVEKTLNYIVPDYFNGTLRVMAVAVSQDAIGVYEEKSIVKNPYIISPNVPMFSAPGDSFQVTVTVTNTVAGSGKKSPVKLNATTTPHLKVYQPNRKLFIDEDGDTTVTFNVKTKTVPGAAALNFKASGAKESTRLAAYLSVRPAIPYRTSVVSGVLQDNDIEVETPRRMYDAYRILEGSVSFLPLGLSKGLLTYLDKFPYGCTEQVVSQAFPYLYLKNINGFGIDDQSAAEKITYALKVLQARQNDDGKFGIWAANSFTSDFITVYGMHFITECKKAGYYISDNLYINTLNALKTIAGQKSETIKDWRVQSYAIYVLTQNEIITTNHIATLRTVLEKNFENWNKDLLGGYLAGSYMIMKQADEANSIFKNLINSKMTATDSWYFCDTYIQKSQLLYLLAEHSPEMLKNVSAGIINDLASFMREGRYNTITSAYAVLALHTYSKVAGEPQQGQVVLRQILHDKNEENLKLPSGKFPSVDFSEYADKLLIKSDNDLPLYYQVVQAGFDKNLPEKRISNEIEIFREFTDKQGKGIYKAGLGDEIGVHIKFRSISGKSIYNIAIVDLLPAGLEATPTTIRENRFRSWNPDHIDIREDRLVIYGTIGSKTDEFIYTVRAINKGLYTVPPIYAESMYDKSINGISPQEPFIVE